MQALKALRVAKILTDNPDSEYLVSAFGLVLNNGERATTEFKQLNDEYKMPDVPVIEIIVRFNKNDTVICNLTFLFEDGTQKRFGEVNTEGRVSAYEFSEGE